MTTYKNELKKIEAQEKQLNAQKKQLAKQKRQLKAQLAEEQERKEKETAKSTKQWFADYCLKFNIECKFDDRDDDDVYIVITGKNGQKFAKAMYLEQKFTAGNQTELKNIVNEFYNIANVIDTLSSILAFSEVDEAGAVRFTTFENSRYGYHTWFDTIYLDIRVCISYYKDLISVRVVYEEGDIRDTTITLANGVELVTESTGYDRVYMEIQKTVKVKTDQLDTLLKKVEKAVKQVQEITVEDN